jgi:hypothetical protein
MASIRSLVRSLAQTVVLPHNRLPARPPSRSLVMRHMCVVAKATAAVVAVAAAAAGECNNSLLNGCC